MTPSIKRIAQFWPDKAKEIRGLMDFSISPMNYSDVQEWAGRCFNMPSRIELVMCALNQVLEGAGTEAIFGDRIKWPDMEYVNMGDTYNPTVIFDYTADRFRVESWGDWIEAQERKGVTYA